MVAKETLAVASTPPTTPPARRIVYLLGAGATHAEADFHGSNINLLMNRHKLFGDGVSKRVLAATGATELTSDEYDADIEKLISLLMASGSSSHSERAARMREAYFEDVRNNLDEAGVISDPALAKGLFAMHKVGAFKANVEDLVGVITTNHDGLLQVASQDVFGGLDLGFSFKSDEFTDQRDEQTPPILQLHGSFAWRFEIPLRTSPLTATSDYHPDTVWIPPTILKEAKNYPFNKLTGHAYELLAKRCDVLRVIGASLTQNDWNILCLIFNAQRHRELIGGTIFDVELIGPPSSCANIQRDCPYLRKVFPIDQLKEPNMDIFQDLDLPDDSEPMRNPFSYWLSKKIDYHLNHGHFGDAALPDDLSRVLGENGNGTTG